MAVKSARKRNLSSMQKVTGVRELADAKIRASFAGLILQRKENKILDFDIVLLTFLGNLCDDWLIPMNRQRLADLLNERYLRVCASLKRLQDAGHLLVVKHSTRKGIIISPELLNEGWPGKKMRKTRFWKRMIKLMGKENEPQFSIHC